MLMHVMKQLLYFIVTIPSLLIHILCITNRGKNNGYVTNLFVKGGNQNRMEYVFGFVDDNTNNASIYIEILKNTCGGSNNDKKENSYTYIYITEKD